MRLDANQLQTTDNSLMPNWLLEWCPRPLLPTTSRSLLTEIVSSTKQGAAGRRFGLSSVKLADVISEQLLSESNICDSKKAAFEEAIKDPEYCDQLATVLRQVDNILLKKRRREGRDDVVGPMTAAIHSLASAAGQQTELDIRLTEADLFCVHVELGYIPPLPWRRE
jgi:hypothetical protein